MVLCMRLGRLVVVGYGALNTRWHLSGRVVVQCRQVLLSELRLCLGVLKCGCVLSRCVKLLQ